ncbi:hypothetical protein V6N11_048272 [Hibiscus sabdariffa]|uniref:DUF4218 domain-containing protein n=1 Tax=Hibiscus sabdariffa TaxID=183260 RepID=A0ABR2PV93_9ROSI
MTNEVTSCMIELSNIMKFICGKVLVVEELEQLQDRVSLTLCNLKKIFPPSFFTIMVHLLVHLPQEAKVGGPVFYRWMYPIERFLDKLKSYCRNKRYPEGSITEGYLADECLTFCSRYLEDVDTTFNRPNKNDLFVTNELAQTYLFGSYGEPIDKIQIEELDDMSWVQAHQYVLFHHDSIDSLRTAFLRSSARSRKVNQRGIDKLFTETFHEWLGQTVWSGREVSDDVKWLCQGPNRIVKRYSGFLINGFKFHTKTRERLRKTHNCGVVVTSSTTSYASARDNCLVEGDVEYYGILTDIIELEYYGKRKVVSFCCVWIDVNTTRGKMPRRKLTSLRTIRDPPLEEEINVHEKTGLNGRRRTRGRTTLPELYDLPPEKLREKRTEYETSASTAGSAVNMADIDNQVITEVFGPERYGRVRGTGSFVTPTKYFGFSSSKYMPSQSHSVQAQVDRVRQQLQQEMDAKIVAVQAEAATREAALQGKVEDMQSQLANIMKMLNKNPPQNPPY